MINVSLKVGEIIWRDEVALEALRGGLLNLSAYADTIHKEVETLTHKEVKRGTIVVALARMRGELAKVPPLSPAIEITNISTKSGLNAYTYEKTLDIQRKIAMLHPFLLPLNDLFSITEGPSEITIVFADKSKKLINKHFSINPIIDYHDVVAISVQFPEKYADVPNFLYAVFSKLATLRINLWEVVATHTEISFIVKKEDMTGVMETFNVYLLKENHEK